MRILDIKVLRGPNYWSNYRKKLIAMQLDLGIYEELPTNKIEGFADRLFQLIPSLYSHRCSVGVKGGFLMRLQEGTWLGHVVEHVALELQTLAGMDCGFGRTRSADQRGVYHVVFSYEIRDAGIYAAHAAVKLVEATAQGLPYPLQQDIKLLQEILYDQGYGPSTQALVKAAENREIPATRLNTGSLVMFGQGKNQKNIRATIASTTSNIAVDIAGDKEETKKVLEDNFIPVPEGRTIANEAELDEAINELSYPLVIKPLDGNHGRGITTNIRDREQALIAMTFAKEVSDDIIVEKYVSGDDYRLLVINFKLVAAAKRTPALVIGNGVSTVRQLIDDVNRHPDRGIGHEKVLTKIKVDENTLSILKASNCDLQTVLPFGKVLKLKDTANLSTGGTAIDVTDLLHPRNIFMAERIARLVGLDICGIDIVADDISKPIGENNGAVLEVNAAPGFRMHQFPSEGKSRDVATAVVDMLFPKGASSRIPIIAVTGTNGKTTSVRLLAHLAKQTGYHTGFTTTDGIYINNELITDGDCSGPGSAAVVLRDPLVDFAVLECARGGILRAGLGFDHCNVSVVTNISEDHLGLNGINTIEELAKVKKVVPASTFNDGYAVLNADDDLVYAMREDLTCNIALFSTEANNYRIHSHFKNNGKAAVVEEGNFTLYDGLDKTIVLSIEEVPLTLNGKSNSMIQNILASILAAAVSNIPIDIIRSGLKSFIPSPEMTPGRMNEFKFDAFRLIIDYAHNVGGYKELKSYLAKVKASVKTGIVAATGDRRDDDIMMLGQYAAEIFDEIIIRHDKDGRGRTNEEITALLRKGIDKVKTQIQITVISDEAEAITYAVTHAKKDALIFVCSDEIQNSLSIIKNLKEKQKLVGYDS